MNGFGNKSLYQIKNLHFNKQGLTQKMDAVKIVFLRQAGAFVMTASRRLIRPGKKPSSPGTPPKGHKPFLLRKNIFFGIDTSGDPAALIGPVRLNQVDYDKDLQPVRGTIPSVLESGGQVWFREVLKNGKWRRADQRSIRRNAGLPARFRKVEIAARPFMGPALDVSEPKFPQMLKRKFKKG